MKTRPQGWTPQQLERAYRLPVNLRSHQTVAVSIACRTPHLGSYLRTYRAHFGLPACGQPSGCLRIVNQKGKATPGRALRAWAAAGTSRPRSTCR